MILRNNLSPGNLPVAAVRSPYLELFRSMDFCVISTGGVLQILETAAYCFLLPLALWSLKKTLRLCCQASLSFIILLHCLASIFLKSSSTSWSYFKQGLPRSLFASGCPTILLINFSFRFIVNKILEIEVSQGISFAAVGLVKKERFRAIGLKRIITLN